MDIDYDKLYEDFNEYCGNKTDCEGCPDIAGCFRDFLKARQQENNE